MKIFFTWWNKQTIGTFIKTFLLGNLWEKMITEISITKIKMMKDG